MLLLVYALHDTAVDAWNSLISNRTRFGKNSRKKEKNGNGCALEGKARTRAVLTLFYFPVQSIRDFGMYSYQQIERAPAAV